MLIETVHSIALQECRADIQVIIVSKTDRAGCDKLQRELDTCGLPRTPVILNIGHEKTISHARNIGAAAANGKYLAFVDSDIRLSTNWIETMLEKLADPATVLASAVQLPDREHTNNHVIRSALSMANVGSVEALPGANLFMERALFNRTDKFPEHLQTCEDSVFTNSLLSSGKLVLTDDSGFVHLGEDATLQSMFTKEIWRGKSNLASMQDRKIALSEIPSLVFPPVVLMCFLLALIMLVAGAMKLALVFAVLMAIPPALYASRLKLRSSIKLGSPHIFVFFLVYFLARGVGVIKLLIEPEKNLPLDSLTHD
ncbi:hypothetical protein AB833_20610 [Chromatiales bacterium (ex Bugula neritina AB1)]|nr:hypothetical protein AB833_20610 [Chromatiales bacterium (ex Bugula neritina AB1)]